MKSPRRRVLALAASGCLWFSILAPARAVELDGLDVQVGPTVEITRSHDRCWFPTVHRFRSGEILVGMSMCPDARNAEGEFSAYCVSADGGMSWTRRTTLGSESENDGAWSDVPNQDGEIWHWGDCAETRADGHDRSFYFTLAKFSRAGREIHIDTDAVMTAAQPVYLAATGLFDYGFDPKSPVADSGIKTEYNIRAFGNILEGSGGELLCSGYYISAEAGRRFENPRQHFREVLLRSTDRGRTWSEYSTIAEVPEGARPGWMGREGPNEGSLARLSDHRLYAIYRTGAGGMIGNAWSSHGGKTWTPPASIGFSGVAPRVHRLANGMLTVVTGRPGPVAIRFNVNGQGQKWSEPVTLFAGMSTRYADVAEIQPGKLLVVYDSVPYGWQQIPFADRDARNRILGTFVTVGKK